MAEVEFEFSIEKVGFKYKGPAARGQAIQNSINNALATIADAQKKASGDLTPTPQLPKFVESMPVAGDGETKSRKRAKGDGKMSALIDEMLSVGFFSQPRSSDDVGQELSKRGHNYRPNHIAATLVNKTKAKQLTREQNTEGKWVYTAGLFTNP